MTLNATAICFFFGATSEIRVMPPLQNVAPFPLPSRWPYSLIGKKPKQCPRKSSFDYWSVKNEEC